MMAALRATVAEIFSLFVDDRSLALYLIGWTALMGLGAALGFVSGPLGAALLFAGCAAILAENVLRSAARR